MLKEQLQHTKCSGVKCLFQNFCQLLWNFTQWVVCNETNLYHQTLFSDVEKTFLMAFDLFNCFPNMTDVKEGKLEIYIMEGVTHLPVASQTMDLVLEHSPV